MRSGNRFAIVNFAIGRAAAVKGIAIPRSKADRGIMFFARIVGLPGNRIGLAEHIHSAAARYWFPVGDNARARGAIDRRWKILHRIGRGETLPRGCAQPPRLKHRAACKPAATVRGPSGGAKKSGKNPAKARVETRRFSIGPHVLPLGSRRGPRSGPVPTLGNNGHTGNFAVSGFRRLKVPVAPGAAFVRRLRPKYGSALARCAVKSRAMVNSRLPSEGWTFLQQSLE